MKILIMSDIHFEFMADHGDSFLDSEWPEYDVCVIAGDLATSPYIIGSIQKCCTTFKEVVYVAGNHEYFYSSIQKVNRGLQKIKCSNFHWLNNSTVTIDGQRFVGGTMWYRRDEDPFFRNRMCDFSEIKNTSSIFEENDKFLEFINSVQLDEDDVVVTHHLPSSKSVPEQYKYDPLNCYFVCDVQNVIRQYNPKLWVHGHTHTCFDYSMGRTRVCCNPHGYPGENPNFKYNFVVDV